MGKDDLNERIAKAQAKIDAQNRPAQMSAGKGASLGLRMASDFAAAVIVGAILGWGIDAVFGVQPWGLVVCVLLGFVTGVRNVVAQAVNAQKPADGKDEDGA